LQRSLAGRCARRAFAQGTPAIAMRTLTLHYATNRNHLGRERWHPSDHGTRFSYDGIESLPFGKLSVAADDATLAKHLDAPAQRDTGDG
jgi:hypothetical protein